MSISTGIVVNEEKGRFELDIKGQHIITEFKESANVVSITHVEVPASMRDQGMGSAMLNSVMHHLDSEGKKVHAVCSFAKDYMGSHPEWNHLMAESPSSD